MDDILNPNSIFSEVESNLDTLSMDEESDKIKEFAEDLASSAMAGIHSGSPMYKEFADTFLSAFMNKFNEKLESFKSSDGFEDEDDGNITLVPSYSDEETSTDGPDLPDQAEMVSLINEKVGEDPGYFFFADEEEASDFDTYWALEKYRDALKMIVDAPDLDIEDLSSLQNYIDNN